MLLVDVTYILNLGKVKVRVINMQALPIQCVLNIMDSDRCNGTCLLRR